MSDFVYAPAYQGLHNYTNYNHMKSTLTQHMKSPYDTTIDVDLLFDSELEHFLQYVLLECYRDCYRSNLSSKLAIQTKHREKLKHIRKILKKLVIIYNKVYMKDSKYVMEIE